MNYSDNYWRERLRSRDAENGDLLDFAADELTKIHFAFDVAHKEKEVSQSEVTRLRAELGEAQRKPISIRTALKILQAYFDGGPECAPYDELAALEKAINEWEPHGSSN